jgi:hypothetical protein
VTRISDADQKSQGVLFLKTCQALGGIEAGRTATVVIVAFVAILIAAGCRPEKPVEKPVIVVAAGDIATCSGTGDEATAKLVGATDGATVLTLGDEAYPHGTAQDFEHATSRPGDSSRSAPDPSLGTTSTKPKGQEATSTTSGRPQETPMRATTPTSWQAGT